MLTPTDVNGADSELTGVGDDFIEESRTPERFLQASRSYADRGSGRHAVLAQCAADLDVLQQLLWENGLDELADPTEQLAAVGEAVLDSMTHLTRDGLLRTPRGTVVAFREAVAGTFDESVHPLLAERWSPLDHLDGVEVSYEDARVEALELLAGRTPGALVRDLRATAQDCAAVAEMMVDEGDTAGALLQLWQADLAVFEAHLVERATAASDTSLVTVRLRWQIARGLVSGPTDSPDGVSEPVLAWRRQLTAVVSAAETASLAAAFLLVPSR